MSEEQTLNRKICVSYLVCICFAAQSALAEQGGLSTYDCTAADGSTRHIKSEEHCLAERQATPGQDACRVEYTKDGHTQLLWRARNDPSYCYPRVQDLLRNLEASGFSCTRTDGHISCNDSVAHAEPPPDTARSNGAGRGNVTITPSKRSQPVSPRPLPQPYNEVTDRHQQEAIQVPQLLRETYFSKVTNLQRGYFVYLPGNFSEHQLWPVMLFLHGDAERGDGKGELDFVMTHGPLYEAWVQKRDLPFVIIGPQLPTYDKGELPYIKNRKIENVPRRLAEGTPARSRKFSSDDPMDGATGISPGQYGIEGPRWGWSLHDKELLGMVDHIVRKYRGDPKRVYITGLSYGAFGAWYMASKYPDRFAAINPIVGYAHTDLVDSIAEHQIPVWCFAGGRDAAVPVEYFYAGMNKLEQLGHADVRFTVEEDMNHDVWRRVYAGEDIYNWMLAQSK